MIFLLALVALASANVLDMQAIPETMDWEHWKTTFEKTFTPAEEVQYKANYADNINHILRENAKGHTYRLGVNEYAHMTPDEFYGYYTMKNGVEVPEKQNLHVVKPAEEIADSIDWVERGKVTGVKNQGQCGSCWAFSTTGSTEAATAIANNAAPISLSEQQLVDCAASFGNNGCNGGLMDNGFKYIKSAGGLATEQEYPYTASTNSCNTNEAAEHVSDVSGFHDVETTDTAFLSALNVGPVSIAIEADKSAFQMYRSGVLTDAVGCGEKLDHGVLAVGYGSLSGVDYYKVKNSWGANWGMNGYILMGRGSQYPDGMCGMLKNGSYPTGAHSVSPGPTPAPGPGPSPSGHHYQKPGTDGTCADGDIDMSVSGITGTFCAPQCDSSELCPDSPSGWGGIALCALRDASTGKQYCAVECFGLTGDCGSNSGASCHMSSSQPNVGICTYAAGLTTDFHPRKPGKV